MANQSRYYNMYRAAYYYAAYVCYDKAALL